MSNNGIIIGDIIKRYIRENTKTYTENVLDELQKIFEQVNEYIINVAKPENKRSWLDIFSSKNTIRLNYIKNEYRRIDREFLEWLQQLKKIVQLSNIDIIVLNMDYLMLKNNAISTLTNGALNLGNLDEDQAALLDYYENIMRDIEDYSSLETLENVYVKK